MNQSHALRLKQLKLRSIAVVAVFSVFFILTSYICDDAFIAFRAIDNFIHGYGLRYNAIERVQVFTGPLFTLLIAIFYAGFEKLTSFADIEAMYLAAMLTCYLTSLSLFIALNNHIQNAARLTLVLCLLFSSQAFMFFTSSGLESPMTLLLVGLFYLRYLSWSDLSSGRRPLYLFGLASLGVVNRFDACLLFLPAILDLCWTLIRSREYRKLIVSVLIASIPMILWMAFALTYYGFLFPNSYYAKLGLGLDPQVIKNAGSKYLNSAFATDPITLVVIMAGTVASLGQRKLMVSMCGALGYVYYVYSIGGDFIGFRFLAPPLLIAAIIFGLARPFTFLPTAKAQNLAALSLVPICILYSGFTRGAPLRAATEESPNFDIRAYYASSNLRLYFKSGYFPFAQLHAVTGPDHCLNLHALERIVGIGAGGIHGFCRGPKAFLIDNLSISDPLIARLPSPKLSNYTPGHILKPVPAGYLEAILRKPNKIETKELADYYSGLRLMTRGRLFSWKRWQAIWSYNFGSNVRFKGDYLSRDYPTIKL